METLVFRNGPVFTGDGSAPQTVEVAVQNGRIAALGDAAQAFVRGADEVIDLEGRLLLPGFIDAHIHPISGGIERGRCDLTAWETVEDYRRVIGDYVEDNPAGKWILGGGWSMAAFPAGVPHRALLDELTGERPAFLPNRDHHSAWVNGAALRLAQIDRSTPDPADGRIERDAEGNPTGALHEGAMQLVERHLPEDTRATYDAGLRIALSYLHSLGVTGWQDAMVTADASSPSALDTYLRAAADGWLTARVSGALWWERSTKPADVDAEIARLAALRAAVPDNDFFDIHSVKVMQDGVIETFTASMLDPYLDSCGCVTGNHGIDFLSPEVLLQLVPGLDAHGFQVHFHALGDRAVRLALDALEAARESNGATGNRHHLAHLQFIDDADLPRFRELEATANLQALWAAHEPQLDELTTPFVGERRFAQMYRFGDLHRAGAMLAMGSDWPVSTPDPLAAIHVAVNRFAPGMPAGSEVLGHGQELPLATALRAYTAGSAFLNRREDTGTIRPSAQADLVVLEQNLFDIPTSEIGSVRVERTYVAGAEVFNRQDTTHD